MARAVSTLMAAPAIHISILNALPPTGYLTLADRMMLVFYTIFLFNLAASVYLMRLVDKSKIEGDRARVKLLALVAVALIAVQFFL